MGYGLRGSGMVAAVLTVSGGGVRGGGASLGGEKSADLSVAIHPAMQHRRGLRLSV